jgi:hypothetical protein
MRADDEEGRRTVDEVLKLKFRKQIRVTQKAKHISFVCPTLLRFLKSSFSPRPPP